jgi:hypothetical protein
MEDFSLLVPEPIDPLFNKDAIAMILKAGSFFLKTYNMPPDKIIFCGKMAKSIYDYFIEKKLNLDATLEFKKFDMNDQILIKSKTKVKELSNIGGHAMGESINGLVVPGWCPTPPMSMGGLEIIREKYVEPEVTIALIKYTI